MSRISPNFQGPPSPASGCHGRCRTEASGKKPRVYHSDAKRRCCQGGESVDHLGKPIHPILKKKYIYIYISMICIYIYYIYIYYVLYIYIIYIYDFAAKRWASGIELCNRPLREQLVALRNKNMSILQWIKTSSPVAFSLIFECSFMMLASARRLLQFSKDQDVILKMCRGIHGIRGSHGKGLGEVSWMVQRLVETQSIGIETMSNLLGS